MSGGNTPVNQPSAGKPHVVILGGGPAGLGAAYRISKSDIARATVIEQRSVVGGNAGSFELGGVAVDAAALQRLATLPSREVLLGRLAGAMVSPIAGMASVLAGNLRNLVGVLSAVADKKRASEGGAAA